MTTNDHTIPADKVQELIENYEAHNRQLGNTLHEVARKKVNQVLISDLKALLTPPLPTLAGMTAEEREACHWMQADWTSFDDSESERVIVVEGYGRIITKKADVYRVSPASVTPRPDLPRMVWPSSAPLDPTDAQDLADMDTDDEPELDKPQRFGELKSQPVFHATEREDGTLAVDIPTPDHIPAGEAWVVEIDGEQYHAIPDRSGVWHYIDDEGRFPEVVQLGSYVVSQLTRILNPEGTDHE